MMLDYFYGQSGKLFAYFRIPKALFQDSRFRQLSTDARTLYGILLDRMSLSAKNGWLDEQGRVYIIYTVREVQESLCCAEHKAVKLFRELEQADLIERKRRGLGKPSLICKMIESCQNGKATARMSAAPIQSKIEKIKKRKLNYAAMRADGELPREEYQALCKQADDEVARLEQELKALSPAPEPQTVSSDMKAIYDFLSQKVDVHGACLAPELIEQFVEVVTPIADYSYRWKLNTGCKKSKEERTDLMAVSEKPILTFTIDFETAKRYREANKMPHQFRRAAWTDLTVEVYL